MDYDDNDFQSQNLHLASEGSAKFPPALRPYALPKFDFDESLQGHLRFDSLVETEVFLGIESNDDNQWIDAYSRGSSGIEFSSSATESCTISRHNNVWSEATSSESVEMLLKSVGQEEFIPKQIIIEESHACDEPASLAKQMEPNQKPDDKSTFIGGVTDLQPLERILESSSGLKEDLGMEQPQAGISEAHERELSISGNVNIPGLNDICQNVDLPVPEGLLTDGKNNNENPKDVDTVADKCGDDKPADGSHTSAVQTNIAAVSMQSISSTHDVLNLQNVQIQVISIDNERQVCLPAKANKQDTASSTLNADVDVDNQKLKENAVVGDAHNHDKPHCSDSRAEALESASEVEGLQAAVSNVEESIPLVSVGVSELQKTDREITCSRNSSGDSVGKDASLRDTMLNNQSDRNTFDLPNLAMKGDTNSEGQVVEINKSNASRTYGESSATIQMELVDSGYKMDTKIAVSNLDAHMFTLQDNTTSNEGNRDGKAGGFSSFCEPSSAKSCFLGESTQISENNEVDRQVDREKIHEDVSVTDKERRKPPFDASQMHSDDNESHPAGKDFGLSSLIAGGIGTKLTTSTVLVDVTATNDSASLVTSENTGLMSGAIDVSHPPRNGVSTHEATVHNEVQKTTPVESVPIEEKEHSVPKIAKDAGISYPVGSSDLESVICPVPGSEKQQSSDTYKCETLNNCLQAVRAATENISMPEEKLAEKDIQDCTKDVGVSSVICKSTGKKNDEVTVSFDMFDKEMTVQETNGKPSSKASGDILPAHEPSMAAAPLPESHFELREAAGCSAANFGEITGTASTTIGSSPQTEKVGNEDQASADQNCAVSEFSNRDAVNVLSTSNNPKSNTAFKGERSKTPDVNLVADLSKKDADVTTKRIGKRQSIPAKLAGKASTVVEGSPSSSRFGPKKAKGAGNISQGSPQLSDGKTTRSVSKGTPEPKTRQASNKIAGKESSRKITRGKEKSVVRQSERGDKSSNVSQSQSPGFQLMQSNEMLQYGHIDSNTTKPFAFLNASTSGLPDLNTSAPPVLFQQPFTDLQQVQLRAQIFVYGALIQGTAPDEAYMISAFGGTDGGRNIWENAWRVCMERQHGQKSHPINPETPKQSRYGSKAFDFAVKQSTHQGKGTPSPLGRVSGKPSPTIVNPLIPLSSPLWTVPTPSDSLQSSVLARGSVVDYPQAVASLHPYQTQPLRNFLGHNASWISQSPLRGPWITSPTPAPDNSSHLSAPPVSDTMKLNSVKGSSLPPSSVIKNDTPNIPASVISPQSTSAGTAPLLDTSNFTPPIAQHSSDPKPKKRKKVMVSEDHGQQALQSHSQLEAIPAVSTHLSTPVASTTPVGNLPKTHADKSIVSVSSLSPADHLRNELNVEKRILSDESLAKVKEARVHAEEAATLSAAAVSHSLEIWNQLDKQKNSGLVSDIEAKLASAAVAIAAAAAIAKAAAAAANVASNSAMQAKLMANEALASSGFENSRQSNAVSRSEGMVNFEKSTPASILKGANVSSSSSSIIFAAKEAARRRLEAASAATKQAENLDAIVKAAELTAEAVSQAGKIVTMGDPLPISDLIEAGADGYWKVARESLQQIGLSKDITRGLVNIDSGGDNAETSQKHRRDILSDEMQKHVTASEKSTLNKMYETSEDNMMSITGLSNPMNINESNSRGPKGRRVSDLVNLVDVVPQTEIQASSVIIGDGSERLADNNIKEGSFVEVFKDGEGFKAAWFTANVLSLNDGKAHVCYNVLLAEEGSLPLKEWVPLEGEVDKPPIIRMARPLSGLLHEGTRKRRRASMGDYAWSVGDRVDAWLQESWWEGVVTERNKKDETLTVHFPAHGETSVVRAWQLRPSLVWKDGKWIKCCKKGVDDNSNHEGDTPHEKRPKLGSPALEARGEDKMSKNIDAVESDELRLLDLAQTEKVFNIGKTGRNENKTDTHRMVRTGLQKEGSRVIFGVPKPGKKRKFIEVSKHYVADGSNKVNDGNDSVKLANFLMPQGSRSFGWKNSSKNEVKEKRVDSKPKIFKSGKPQNILGRTVPQKENPEANTISHSKDQTDRTEKIKDSVSQFKISSESGNQMETASYSGTEGAAEGPILYSSLATSTDASSKRASTSRASKGKLAPAGGKLGKIEEEKASTGNDSMKSTTEFIEPRRSNRRIQPTSRLLEGLQSSLIISKIPSVSHDKGQKNPNRNTSKKGE